MLHLLSSIITNIKKKLNLVFDVCHQTYTSTVSVSAEAIIYFIMCGSEELQIYQHKIIIQLKLYLACLKEHK